MRIILAFAFLLTFAVSTPLFAQAAKSTDESAVAADPENRLDELFTDLKRERNERAAERMAKRIQKVWTQSGSDTVNLLMQWSAEAMQKKKYGVALDFLDQVITLKPGFAEGWNRRATVHYLMESYGKSMSDIDRTLRLEPRHFGALAGMASIFKLYDDKEAARNTYRRILEIYPMMRNAQNEFISLTEDLAGQGI